MPSGYDYRKFTILYVDDEEKSLKYFRKALDDDFRIITAISAEAASEILDREAESIGVLISDQRMPGESGVELLGRVRQSWPEIVRILTTAYADLDSAIEAVNSGAIFKYVVKPWNPRDLRGLLLRAMEFFLIRQERNTLMREKIGTIQRLIVSDRVQSLAVLAAGLAHHIRNSMTALKTFLDLAPRKLREEIPDDALQNPDFWKDLWSLAQRESLHIMELVQRIVEATVEPNYEFDQEVPIVDLLERGRAEVAEDATQKSVTVELVVPPSLRPLKVNMYMMQRLFGIVLRHIVRHSSTDDTVRVSVKEADSIWGTTGIALKFSGGGRPWANEDVAATFTPFRVDVTDPSDLGLDLLSAFFICHHHGGDILLRRDADEGATIEIRLPYDPNASEMLDSEGSFAELVLGYVDDMG